MTVSLRTIAGRLKRTTGIKSLKALVDDGYTRTLAADDYARVNPFEVEGGNADDPSSPTYGLSQWELYDHDSVPAGDDLEVASGYGTVTLDWIRPTDYPLSGAALGPVTQRISAKDSGETTVNVTSLSVDPFDTPDQTQDAGDGDTDDVSLSTYGDNYVAVGVKAEFDDSDEVFTGVGYDGKVGEDILLGAGAGILVKPYGLNPGPLSVTQTTDPDSCATGDNVNLRIQCTMEGTSTGRLEQQENGGSWTLVDSSVAAGTLQINLSRQSGNNYKFRLRYNDVSPDDWATQTGTVSAVCNLI